MQTILIHPLHAAKLGMLVLPTCKGIYRIDVCTIVRVEAISNYSKLFFNNGKTLVAAKVLSWFEERLAPAQFLRIHRSHIVNKNFIDQYLKGCGGKIKLLNGECIDVSKRRKNHFLKCWLSTAA